MSSRQLAPDQLSDETLLAGLASGDRDAAIAFVRRFQSKVLGIAIAVVNDVVLAEDVAQTTFERVWRHAQVYDSSRGSVKTWLSTITRNIAIDVSRMRRATPVDPSELLAQVAAPQLSPEHLSLVDDASSRLRSCLRRLPVEQARALVMASVYGLTAAEVASAEDIPLGTAKTRIRIGLIHLRQALETANAEAWR